MGPRPPLGGELCETEVFFRLTTVGKVYGTGGDGCDSPDDGGDLIGVEEVVVDVDVIHVEREAAVCARAGKLIKKRPDRKSISRKSCGGGVAIQTSIAAAEIEKKKLRARTSDLTLSRAVCCFTAVLI